MDTLNISSVKFIHKNINQYKAEDLERLPEEIEKQIAELYVQSRSHRLPPINLDVYTNLFQKVIKNWTISRTNNYDASVQQQIKVLSNLKNLEHLKLSEIGNGDFPEIKNLKILSLYNCYLSDNFLTNLKQYFPNLERVEVRSSNVNLNVIPFLPSSVKFLSLFGNLRESKCQKLVEMLKGMENLENLELTIDTTEKPDEQKMKEIFESLPNTNPKLRCIKFIDFVFSGEFWPFFIREKIRECDSIFYRENSNQNI